MIQFMENHNFEKGHLEMFEDEFCTDIDCARADIPELAEDYQVQLNTWRRTEAVSLGKSQVGYRYLLEFHEAPSSYRGFFFEVHILPEAYPFDDCHGESCQGGLI